MALVGRIETRPTSTTSRMIYRVMVVRCLLCGHRGENVIPSRLVELIPSRLVERGVGLDESSYRIVPYCACYDTNRNGITQPVRIVSDDH